MKISEMLIEICIFSIIVFCLLESFTVFNSNKNRQKSSITNSLKILNVDSAFRDEIKQISFEYWKNPEKQFLEYKDYLTTLSVDKDVIINSVEIVKNSKSKPEGFLIYWTYKNNTYETKEKIASRIYTE